MCDDCKELKLERDELLEALRLEDGRAAEIFSEYFANKAMVKSLRKERDELAAKVRDLENKPSGEVSLEEEIVRLGLEDMRRAEQDIQNSYMETLDAERAASLKYLKGFCMVCEERNPCNCK